MAYEQQKFMTHSSGGRKSKVMVQAWSGEGPYPGCRLLVVPSWGERTREFYGIRFIRALILIMRQSPKATLSYTILDIRTLTYGFGAQKHSDHSSK